MLIFFKLLKFEMVKNRNVPPKQTPSGAGVQGKERKSDKIAEKNTSISNAQQEYLQIKSMKSQSDMFGLTFSLRGSVTVVTKDQIAQTVKEKKQKKNI